MIKAGDKVVLENYLGKSIVEVEKVIETVVGNYYKLKDRNSLYFEDEVIEILPEKKDGLYVTINCDAKLEEKMESIIEKAMKRHIEAVEGSCCELQEYATNEHSYYTADGKEMLSTWKQKGGHVYDVHVFEKVTECNWKQLS